MADDKEVHNLQKWLETLGCPVNLTSANLKRLAAPNMRSVWRHLQDHVMKVHTVRTIKKNLLLMNIQNGNTMPCGSENLRIESIEQLNHLEKLSRIRKEISKLNEHITIYDEKLHSDVRSLAVKNAEKLALDKKVREAKEKTEFFKLKELGVKDDKEMVVDKTKSVNSFKSGQKEFEQLDVTKILRSDTSFDENMYELFKVFQEVPANTIFNSGLLSLQEVLKKLHCFMRDIEELNSKNKHQLQLLPLDKYLNDLYCHLIKNDVNNKNLIEKIKANSADLRKEKTNLINFMETMCKSNNSTLSEGSECEDVTAKALVDKLIFSETSSAEAQKLQEVKQVLQEECSSLNYSVGELKDIANVEENIYSSIEKKVDDIHKLTTFVLKNKVFIEKEGSLKRSTQHVSTFLSDNKCKKPELEDLFNVLSFILDEEFKVYGKVPMTALSRKWENSELLPEEVISSSSKNPELLCLLHHSATKNILKNLLEKKYWLITQRNL